MVGLNPWVTCGISTHPNMTFGFWDPSPFAFEGPEPKESRLTCEVGRWRHTISRKNVFAWDPYKVEEK